MPTPTLLPDAPNARRPAPPAADRPAADDGRPVTVIQAGSGWGLADLRELWRFRELLYCLTVRDVKVRYKQTILGFGWAVFQPISAVVVFAVFIGRMGGAADGVADYTLLVLSGVLPWTFFSNAVNSSANSMVANERLVTKTYFPRLILPIACTGVALFDFLIGTVLLAGWMAATGVPVGPHLLLAPLVFGLLATTAVGFGVFLAGLIAAQRDFRHLLGFGMQMWMFATPCIYLPADKIGPAARDWLPLNPAYGLILNLRACLLGTDPDLPALAVSAAVGLAVLAVGLLYFRRVERTLADTI